jgi:hypothetical protein
MDFNLNSTINFKSKTTSFNNKINIKLVIKKYRIYTLNFISRLLIN